MLRYLSKFSVSQDNFCQNSAQSQIKPEGKKLIVCSSDLDFDLGFFHLTDLLVYASQPFFILGPEILTSGNFCNFFQTYFIQLVGNIDISFSQNWVIYRIQSHPRFSRSDDVDFYILSLCQLGCCERVDFSGIVDSVRQQNYYFAFGNRMPESINRIGYTQTDGSTIFYQAEIYAIDEIQQNSIIRSQRALGKAFSGKNDQPYSI